MVQAAAPIIAAVAAAASAGAGIYSSVKGGKAAGAPLAELDASLAARDDAAAAEKAQQERALQGRLRASQGGSFMRLFFQPRAGTETARDTLG